MMAPRQPDRDTPFAVQRGVANTATLVYGDLPGYQVRERLCLRVCVCRTRAAHARCARMLRTHDTPVRRATLAAVMRGCPGGVAMRQRVSGVARTPTCTKRTAAHFLPTQTHTQTHTQTMLEALAASPQNYDLPTAPVYDAGQWVDTHFNEV
jgi:hypothetical protein